MTWLEPGFAPAAWPAAGAEGRDLLVGRVRLPAEPGVDAALDGALSAAGLGVIDVALPGWWTATAAAMRILAAEAWQVHQALWRQHAAELSRTSSARLRDASSLTPPEVAAAWERAKRWDTELAEVFAQVDVLALPTLAGPPPRSRMPPGSPKSATWRRSTWPVCPPWPCPFAARPGSPEPAARRPGQERRTARGGRRHGGGGGRHHQLSGPVGAHPEQTSRPLTPEQTGTAAHP